MREIKFRCFWSGVNAMRYFVPGNFEDTRNGYAMTFIQDGEDRNIFLGKAEVMQFTGLKDKNGKEIYEGDILGLIEQRSYRFGQCGTVEYVEDHGSFVVRGRWSKNQHYEILTCDVAIDCEIIGNRYENQELLECPQSTPA